MNTLTIILVTFQRQDELRSALFDLSRQSYPHKEIIVVDNNLDPSFLSGFAREFPDVLFLRPNRNLGAAAGRNFGLNRAKGEFCAFVDDDVSITSPEALETAVQKLIEHEKVAGISFRILGGDGKALRDAIPRIDKKDVEDPYFCANFCSSACVFKTSALKEIGGFWETLFIDCEELDLSYRLIDKGWRLLHLPYLSAVNKTSTLGRPHNRFVFRYASNRFLVAVRNLPVRYAVSTVLVWWAFLFVWAVRNRQLSSFFAGVGRGVSLLSEALRIRRPLSTQSMTYVRDHFGRSYY